MTSSAVKDPVDTSHSGLGDLDLDQVHGLEESGVGEHGGGAEHTTYVHLHG